MNKDHCEDFAGAFVGRVLREHWEGVPWETGRKKGEDQGTWRGPGGRGRGPGDVAGARVQRWGPDLPRPSPRGTAMRSRVGQTPLC